MTSITRAWVSKFQTAQNENHLQLTLILNGLKDAMVKSHPHMNTKEVHTLVNQQLKKYHAQISKCAKRLEGIQIEESVTDFPLHDNVRSATVPYLKFCFDHLCHLGKKNTTDSFTDQGGNRAKSSYMEDIYEVIQTLQHGGDLSVAENWIFDKLTAHCIDEGTSDQLTYCIAKIKFLTVLATASCGCDKNYLEALEMSQVLFPIFYIKNIYVSELNEMMCCLLLAKVPSLNGSAAPLSQSAPPPWLLLYPHLTAENAVQQACLFFRAAAAQLHGLPPPHLSALHVLLHRGLCAASVLNDSNTSYMNSTTQQRNSWEDLEHMCFPLPASSSSSSSGGAMAGASLGELMTDQTFHSVFTCPVSRELASEENLPMLLQCGHVVLSSSMRALPSSGRSGRFKCPTCYHEMRQDACMALHLQRACITPTLDTLFLKDEAACCLLVVFCLPGAGLSFLHKNQKHRRELIERVKERERVCVCVASYYPAPAHVVSREIYLHRFVSLRAVMCWCCCLLLHLVPPGMGWI